jgi:hypothetical protein
MNKKNVNKSYVSIYHFIWLGFGFGLLIPLMLFYFTFPFFSQDKKTSEESYFTYYKRKFFFFYSKTSMIKYLKITLFILFFIFGHALFWLLLSQAWAGY